MAAVDFDTSCALCAVQLATPKRVAQWQPLIAQASARFGVPQAWIRAVIAAESGGHTLWNGRPIVSSAGAMGLMQVMPGTYHDMRLRYGLGPDPFDPHDNIWAGTAFLRALYLRYGYPYLFAAYHAGPSGLDDFLWRNQPLPQATVSYLRHVLPSSVRNTLPTRPIGHDSEGGLFFATTTPLPSVEVQFPNRGLFVPLTSAKP